MIKFKTINVDGMAIEREFNNVEEINNDWYSDDCTLPMLDDEVVFAEIDGKNIEANVFEDILYALGVC